MKIFLGFLLGTALMFLGISLEVEPGLLGGGFFLVGLGIYLICEFFHQEGKKKRR